MSSTRRQVVRLTVDTLEDRCVPAVTAAYTVTQDWGTGFQAAVKLSNSGPASVPFGSLSFTLPATVSSIWDAMMVARAGDKYTVTNAGWNATLPAGGSVSFGFVAGPAKATAGAFVLNGVAVGDGTSPPPVPPPPVSPPPASPPPAAGSGAVTFRAASDWGSGMNGEITVKNAGTTAISNWSLAFTLPGTIGSIWSAKLVGRVGNRYTVAPEDWSKAIPAGGSVSFGFSATPGGIAATNFALTATGVPTSPPVSPPPASPPVSPPPAVAPVPAAVQSWPAQVFAPYVDATLYPYYDFVAAAQTTGARYFTLAFVTADPQNRPAWGGYAEYAVTGTEFDANMRTKIGQLRALGGDVAVSFGGAAGRELAEVVTNTTALAAAYRSVIQAYNLTHIDFDIEGAAAAHKASIDRRWDAVRLLQVEAAAAGKELHVRVTLPVLPTGLTPDGVYVLQSAKQRGVRLDVVNVMAMDYGGSAAPNPQGRMGDYAIQAGTSLFNQLTALHGSTTTEAQRWRMVGITPMIGMNDVQTEIFDQQEAREVLAWAQQKKIGLLSFWSLNRDKQNPAGAIGYVDLQSSSVLQSPFEFTGIFKPFTG